MPNRELGRHRHGMGAGDVVSHSGAKARLTLDQQDGRGRARPPPDRTLVPSGLKLRVPSPWWVQRSAPGHPLQRRYAEFFGT
jgi:hypothetical protein